MRILNTISAKRKNNEGFTLVELMIVVAIIGVLAALSIYGVSKYLANAKSAEARNGVGAIAKGAVSGWEAGQMVGTIVAAGAVRAGAREFCAAAAAVPAATPSGEKYQSQSSDWAAGGWPCLRYTMTGPQYYSYSYAPTGTGASGDTFAISALGDLDGDSTTSTFVMLGAVQGDQITLSPAVIETLPEE